MPRLKNPVRDAGEVEASLRRLGFATTKLVNTDGRALNDGFKRFAQSAVGAEAIFVFYSGHGAQLEGRTWLLPVDTRLETKEDVNGRQGLGWGFPGCEDGYALILRDFEVDDLRRPGMIVLPVPTDRR